MAAEPQAKIPALSEQYSLLKIEETKEENVETMPVPEVKAVVEEKSAEEVAVTTAAAPEGGAEVVPENTETEAAKEEANPAPEVEDSASTETEAAAEEGEAQEEQPEIKIETAPADFRFPTTNQTRHCFTRYIEYHRCLAAKGEDAPECDKFAKYYRSLCPSEWVERWNEQRENGTFPGPL